MVSISGPDEPKYRLDLDAKELSVLRALVGQGSGSTMTEGLGISFDEAQKKGYTTAHTRLWNALAKADPTYLTGV